MIRKKCVFGFPGENYILYETKKLTYEDPLLVESLWNPASFVTLKGIPILSGVRVLGIILDLIIIIP
jgi:hypothetical protein